MEIAFSGKRALVTGAGKGIGRSVALKLVELGAETYAISRTQADLDSLKTEAAGIHTVLLDLSDWEAARKAVEQIGPVDLLVNNAGVTRLGSFLEVPEEDIDYVFGVNYKAVFNVSQAPPSATTKTRPIKPTPTSSIQMVEGHGVFFEPGENKVVAKGMIAKGQGGSIVNLSSVASSKALYNHAVYCSTKGALDMLTKVMALELGPHKIRVNSVNPTVVFTEMGKKAWSDPEKSKAILSRIPLGKFVEVEDVVNSIMFLLSDKSAMTNGVGLLLEGGLSVS